MSVGLQQLRNIFKRLDVNRVHRRPRRKVLFQRRDKFIKNWTFGSGDLHKTKVNMESSDIFLGATDVSDYITGHIMFARNDQKLETHHKEFTILADVAEWRSTMLQSDLRNIELKSDHGLVINDDQLSYIEYIISSASIIVKIYGDMEFIDTWYIHITDQHEEVKNVIEWVYNGDGSSVEIPIRGDRKPINEMYPFLNGEDLGDYYDRFLRSSSSILLLIGPPGTGKTTFIRGLLQHAELSAMVTYDTAILAKDHLFANFIEGDRNVMIIEDADNFLGARTDGNDFMHKFLNVGDGLVTTKNKKMIFSTNLPSVRDIDPALIRPGRCFDIVYFDTLSGDQAKNLASKLDLTFEEKEDGNYSIADVFHKQVEAPKAPRRKLGFV